LNDIYIGGEWRPVKWSFRLPFTLYFVAWCDMGGLYLIEFVRKYFDPKTGKYFFQRPEYSFKAPWGDVKSVS
jgi:hypothetical protein